MSHPDREMSHGLICCGAWLLAPSDQKCQREHLEVGNPAMVKPRDGQAELIVCKAKPVALFNQGTWGMGQLELRPQTKSP